MTIDFLLAGAGFVSGCVFTYWQMKGAEQMNSELDSQNADYMELLSAASEPDISSEFAERLISATARNEFGLRSGMRHALGIDEQIRPS